MAEEYKLSFTAIDIDEKLKKIDSLVQNSGGNAVLTAAQVASLNGMFKVCAFSKADISAEYSAFKTAFGIEDSGDAEPDTPVEPGVTLTNISATYSGGDVAVGTSVNNLTGIVVRAYYSDSTSKIVTGYTLSGEIAEGSNTITVTFQGLTTTITVTGVVESDTSGKLLLSDKTANASKEFSMQWAGNPVVPAVMMADFDETNHKTALSGKTITKIVVQVNTGGTISIGKCDLTNIYTGTAPIMKESNVYTAVAGMNTFNVNIDLGSTETLAFHAVTDTGRLGYDTVNHGNLDMSIITYDQYVSRFTNWLYLNGEIYGIE